jgi:hypothetical protein
MQTATEASRVASKLSRVVRFDPVKLVHKLLQKCIIQSLQSGNFYFDWLGLGMESAVVFNSLPEHVSFFAGSLDSASTHTITTDTYTTYTTIATTATDHYHRQPFLSLSRPSQQITAFTNPRDTSHRGRTDQSHRQSHLSLSRPSQQTTDTTNPGDTPLQNRRRPQSGPPLVYAHCATDFSKHELS